MIAPTSIVCRRIVKTTSEKLLFSAKKSGFKELALLIRYHFTVVYHEKHNDNLIVDLGGLPKSNLNK